MSEKLSSQELRAIEEWDKKAKSDKPADHARPKPEDEWMKKHQAHRDSMGDRGWADELVKNDAAAPKSDAVQLSPEALALRKQVEALARAKKESKPPAEPAQKPKKNLLDRFLGR